MQAFPAGGDKSLISTGGGSEPVWAQNGRELYYREGDKMMAVAVESGSPFRAAAPRVGARLGNRGQTKSEPDTLQQGLR